MVYETIHSIVYAISVIFHDLSRSFFSFPSRYLFSIGFSKYLVLEVYGPHFLTKISICYTLTDILSNSRLQNFILLWSVNFKQFFYVVIKKTPPTTGIKRRISRFPSGWTIPVSIAFTYGIFFNFFSFSY